MKLVLLLLVVGIIFYCSEKNVFKKLKQTGGDDGNQVAVIGALTAACALIAGVVYYLTTQKCTCKHGTAQTDTDKCSGDDKENCTDCDDGFTLNDTKCVAKSGTTKCNPDNHVEEDSAHPGKCKCKDGFTYKGGVNDLATTVKCKNKQQTKECGLLKDNDFIKNNLKKNKNTLSCETLKCIPHGCLKGEVAKKWSNKCKDIKCSPTPCVRADITKDGTVNIDDFLLVQAQFGNQCSGKSGSKCNKADIDKNKKVNIEDLLSLLGQYSNKCDYKTSLHEYVNFRDISPQQ